MHIFAMSLVLNSRVIQMTAPKPKQDRPVVSPLPPISATVALRRLEKNYVLKCEELERAQKRIAVLEAKLKEKKK